MRKAKVTASLALALALAGCGILDQDGEDNAPRHFATPVLNEASRTLPFAQPMGEAMPDTAWMTEAASECEPWQTRDNGCGREAGRATPSAPVRLVRARRPAPARHHVRQRPRCICENVSATTARQPASTPPAAATTGATTKP